MGAIASPKKKFQAPYAGCRSPQYAQSTANTATLAANAVGWRCLKSGVPGMFSAPPQKKIKKMSSGKRCAGSVAKGDGGRTGQYKLTPLAKTPPLSLSLSLSAATEDKKRNRNLPALGKRLLRVEVVACRYCDRPGVLERDRAKRWSTLFHCEGGGGVRCCCWSGWSGEGGSRGVAVGWLWTRRW